MPALLTPSQLEQIQAVAMLGMVTPIVIERRSEAAPPVGGDYGDDFLSFTETSESRRLDVKGWFHSSPAPLQDVNTGAVVTITTYRLFVPVGTDVMVGDLVHVGADHYVVSDTTREGTWLPLLTCSLRKAE